MEKKLIENLKNLAMQFHAASPKTKNDFLQILTSYKMGSLFVAFL
jgi:hypothetical protein